MSQTIQAKNIDLPYLIDNFGIQLVLDDQFFCEWQEKLPELTDLDKQLLDKVKSGYFNLLNYPPLLEDVVRMAIIDPILFIAVPIQIRYNIISPGVGAALPCPHGCTSRKREPLYWRFLPSSFLCQI